MNTKPTLSMNEHPLKPYIDAVRDDAPGSAAADAAQRRLMNRLNESARKEPAMPADWENHPDNRRDNRSDNNRDKKRDSNRGNAWGWGLRATAAAVLAVLVLPLLIIVPGSNGHLAFADVQSFFSDFRTMHARMTTSMNGNEIMAMDVVVDDQDRARIDTGTAFSIIVDPNRQEMLQLFHDARMAARVPLTGDGAQDQDTGMDWLAEIREYQGRARLIDETRVIDGAEVFGFRMTEHAIDMTLWATESGQPVLLEMQTGHEAAPTTTRIRFEFDRPVDPERFSLDVPAGYSSQTRSDDR